MKKYKDFLNESFLPKDKQDSLDKILAFEKRVLSDVKNIVMYEEEISEKNFTYINAMNVAFDEFMITIRSDAKYHKDLNSFINKRSNYAAEFIYDNYFKDSFKISRI